jgi:MFS transporter, MHS family, proline/betaine transporter
MHNTNRSYIVSMFGTALEYYDSSLYGFMAPILISVFLPHLNPLDALIISFLAYPVSIVSRPIGAIIIGRIGDIWGRKKALTISIFGIATVTGIIGILPTYKEIGISAPIIFTLMRSLQSFFIAGEYNGGAIYLLEHNKNKNIGYISGLYCAFTVSGILSAALMSTIVSHLSEDFWRLPYILGFLTGLFGFYIRSKAKESPEFIHSTTRVKINFKLINENYKKITCIIGIAAFFGVLYTMPAFLMTSLVPIISTISNSQTMLINSSSLFIYMLLLPISGYIADKIGLSRSMLLAAIATTILALPLFQLLLSGSILTVFIVKTIFAVLSAWYIGPFHALVQSMFNVSTRYSFISFSYSIGSQVGGSMPGISLWVWKMTNNINLVALILIFWTIIGAASILYRSRTIKPLNTLS